MKTPNTLKTFIRLAAIPASAAWITLSGCKSVPTNDNMYKASYAVGVAAGMAADNTKIDDASRNAVCDILNKVAYCTPETNQTFSAAWTPIARSHTDKLIAEEKLTEAQGILVMKAFDLAVSGLDYLFEVRFPKASQYKELTSAAVEGFTEGFLLVFKPADGSSLRSTVEYDAAAYEWLKARSTNH